MAVRDPGQLERTVAFVRDRQEEAARRAGRAASPPANVEPSVASAGTLRSSGRPPA